MKNLKTFALFEFKKNEELDKARKGVFSLDGEKEYAGCTFEEYWNGFDCPYFEKAEADKLMKDLKGKFEDDEYSFYTEDIGGEGGESDEFKPSNIETEDGKKKVWAIGAYCWVWGEVTKKK